MAKPKLMFDRLYSGDVSFDDILSELSDRDHAFWNSIEEESDRGFAICASCHFENLLERCLSCYFRDRKRSKDILGGVASAATARAKLSNVLGILDDFHYSQMIRLFEIRNAFAHDIMTDFVNAKIAGLGDRFVSLRFEGNTDFILEMPTENPQSAHRQKFSFICMTMSIELQWREIDVLKYSQNLESLQDDGGTIPFLDYNENASS